MDTQPPERLPSPINSNWSQTPFCTQRLRLPWRSLFPTGKFAAILNRRIHAACFTNAISLAIRSLPGVAFQRVLVRYRTESGTGLRHLPADGGGVRRTVESRRGDADPAYQSRRNADHLVTEKFSDTSTFTASTKTNSTAPAKKYQLFTLYQIRNKRMTRTLLTLLSLRNGKRLADGIRGAKDAGRSARQQLEFTPVLHGSAYRVAHFVQCGAKRTSSTICGGPAAGAVSHYHRMLFRL